MNNKMHESQFEKYWKENFEERTNETFSKLDKIHPLFKKLLKQQTRMGYKEGYERGVIRGNSIGLNKQKMMKAKERVEI